MSDLERAAAEHLRQQRELSARETASAEAAEQARAREQQLLRDRAAEFFAFARRHGAPLLCRYIAFEGDQSPSWYERKGELCVVAKAWNHGMGSFTSSVWRWAVTEDGTVFPEPWEASIVRPKDVRDELYFLERPSYYPQQPHLGLADHFAPAAAALLEPLPIGNGFRTGVQTNGWIGYRWS
ncbi:hypothetical protein [Streptomyces rubellomurinus]|uniref:Uncharacterized protein n=1 Tax=Streptomyces rubellomurinus (strain ATCC 31215) TaxID=359131 RepID=A0A0F2TCC1_STRR3|nr:hypothetical protein [Streptomyces rubellomurinus]KJS59950.1 hypothetical protein VM95_24265 [Streptomyces rubellomurinus]